MNLSERFPKMEVTSPLKKVFSKKLHSMVVETSDAKRMRFLLAVSHCFHPCCPFLSRSAEIRYLYQESGALTSQPWSLGSG